MYGGHDKYIRIVSKNHTTAALSACIRTQHTPRIKP